MYLLDGQDPACQDGVPHRAPTPPCNAPEVNATTIMQRSAFTYGYADVGKPILLFEYGVPVRCATDAWREAQRVDWEATAKAAAAKNISGLFPWLFVDRSATGGYGGVYNECLIWATHYHAIMMCHCAITGSSARANFSTQAVYNTCQCHTCQCLTHLSCLVGRALSLGSGRYVFWSANDTNGTRSRDANLQLCSEVAEGSSDSTGMTYALLSHYVVLN
jgi:hypothetical protein